MNSFNSNRRRFLLMAASGLVAGGAAYTYRRGLRLPLLHFAGRGPATQWHGDGLQVTADGAVFQHAGEQGLRFRAFVPEPRFTLRGDRGRSARIRVENLHPEARLEVEGVERSAASLDEARQNLIRTVTAIPSGTGEASIGWRFPRSSQYRFAVIGDSGGGTELQWVLERAARLGADFLIHLGDLYYEKSDVAGAPRALNAADIPTFAAIGNHDFHLGWQPLYPEFVRAIGPTNSLFSLGGVEFVNFDTAAGFLPAARGHRARILQGLRRPAGDQGIRDRVAFTHSPLSDPDPGRDHTVGREAERQWLKERLLSSGTHTLLAGHIHIRDEFDDQGLHTYIAGQGLAHADLITGRQYADILLGDVEPGAPVRYQWQPLNMPFEAHCNARNLDILDTLEKPEVKARLMRQCGKTT